MSSLFTCSPGYVQSVYHASVFPSISQCFTYLVEVQSIHHHYCPCPVRKPPLRLMSNQSNPSCPDPLRIPDLLPKVNNYTITPAHGQSEYHLSNPCLVSKPSVVPMSSQFTISSAHAESVRHLSWQCPVSIPLLLHKFRQYTISSAISSQNTTSPDHIQTVL